MPPPSEEGGNVVEDFHNVENFVPHNAESFLNAEGSQQADSAHNNGDPLAQQSQAPSLTAEEQLTSTADMLALRQKLKQKKAQDADAKNNSAANAKTESASDIQARFTRSKDEAATSAQTTGFNIKNADVTTEARSEGEESIKTPRSDHEDVLGDSNRYQQDDDTGLFQNSTEALPADTEQGSTLEIGQPGANETDDFALDEFEEDMPFSNDEVTTQKSETSQVEDTPPWATDDEPQSSPIAVDSGHVQETFSGSTNTVGFPEQTESKGDLSFARDALNFDSPLSSTYDGPLKPYLNDGNKLTHASQIDEWSNLVEQMPVAGLLKQLVLHASFSREGNQVSLEIDHSQTHLLNDSAKKQLVDAIHHGLGENVDVNITLGEPASTPFALQQEIHAMRHAHAHSVIETDDTIQTLLSTFDASVLTDSVKAR